MVCFFYIDLSGREALQCLNSIKRILTLIDSLEKNTFFKKVVYQVFFFFFKSGMQHFKCPVTFYNGKEDYSCFSRQVFNNSYTDCCSRGNLWREGTGGCGGTRPAEGLGQKYSLCQGDSSPKVNSYLGLECHSLFVFLTFIYHHFLCFPKKERKRKEEINLLYPGK